MDSNGPGVEYRLTELKSTNELAGFFDIPFRRLNYLIYVLKDEQKYDTFEILKSNGKPRRIKAPIKPIKSMQARLARELATLYKPKPCVHAYVTDKGILTNSAQHLGQRWILRVDLKDFFPSIHFGRVYGLFNSAPFSLPRRVAAAIAKLCTTDDVLPQGAPTSPVISNLLCRRLDRKMLALARSHRCFYTRYADDLVFSTNNRRFPANLATFVEVDGQKTVHVSDELASAIESEGFQVNTTKTTLKGNNDRQLVTGIVVNEKRNMPREYVKRLRATLYSWEKFGLESAAAHYFSTCDHVNRPTGKPHPQFAHVVRGKIQHLGAVKGWGDPTYLKLARRLSLLDEEFVYNLRSVSVAMRIKLKIYTEGKTDIAYLKSALKSLQAEGRYDGLELEFHQPDGERGDKELLGMCRHYAESYQREPCIFIFDSDNVEVVKKVKSSTGLVKDWGNRVFSFPIPVPDHRPGLSGVCIEMYFKDNDLKKQDSHGRRLFFREEFDRTTGFDASGQYVYINNKRPNPIIDADVVAVETKRKVAMSKNAFAEHVVSGNGSFSDIDFGAFDQIFNLVECVKLRLIEPIP